ncbi:MAG TPA: tetratricopeptide repeat protein [Cyclobacteriaceae bacterium]|nr:tetratricopeptide repeat protein [Cyclobacteriaceae bacterium]
MLKNRIILVVVSALVTVALYLLPKVVVNNNEQTAVNPADSAQQAADPHTAAPEGLIKHIAHMRGAYAASAEKQKKAIFADSLATLYARASRFDSAGVFAEEAASFFNTEASWFKAGDSYYQAYTFALNANKQGNLGEKAREQFQRVLDINPGNLTAKTKMAMTYLSSAPMQGVTMLREVLEADPNNELALFNMGMLSIQSGQDDKAINWLSQLVEVNPKHTQGTLLLGIAYMNTNQKKKARAQFEKVKDMDKDPAVQATVDSYLKDLK